MNPWGWLFAPQRLRNELRRRYGLVRRRWKTRSERTPPYTAVYNIPKWWWEGSLGRHVLTFFGQFRRDGFHGEVLVGAFEGYTTARAERRAAGGPMTSWGEPQSSEARLGDFQAAAAGLSPAARMIFVGHRGVRLTLEASRPPALYADLALLEALAGALVDRPLPPLLAAVQAGDRALVEKLLKDGADPNEWGPRLHGYVGGLFEWHQSALLLAVERDDPELLRALLAGGADRGHMPWTSLGIAIAGRRASSLRVLLEAGVRAPAEVYPGGRTPLVTAAADGWVEGVRILLEAGMDPEDRCTNRVPALTPRKAAAAGPSRQEIQALIDDAIASREDARGRVSLALGTSGALSLTPAEDAESGRDMPRRDSSS